MTALRVLYPYAKRHRAALASGIFFVIMANFLTPLVPTIVGQAVNFAENRRLSGDELMLFAGLALTVAALAGCFRFLMRRVMIDASRDIEYEIRNRFFQKLESLDPSFFDGNNTGDLMSRATNDMDLVRMMLGPAIMYSANTLASLPLTLFWMFVLDWRLTLLAIVPMLALPPMVKYFSSQTHKASRAQQESFSDLTTMVQENLAGIRVVKAYGQERAQEEKFLERNNDYIRKSLDLAAIQSIFFPSIGFVIGLGYLILLIVGGRFVMEGRLEVGTLLSFLLLFAMIVWPMIAAGWVVNLIQRGMASLERIQGILETEPRVTPPAPREVPDRGAVDIRFDHLTFNYEADPTPRLRDITLDIPAGRTIGIVGPVGAGKSTLIHLLARFYPVERGMILLDGIDINDWPLEELRRRIAFVFQETFLFSDTIGWNIRFGANEDTPQDAVEGAAKRSHVHEDIGAFREKYDQVLGERGVNLSGGQKQRVAIARALLRDAEVLVLDDSLSAVDTHTEEAILKDLREVMRGRTTFLISHRISTVAVADEIIVLEDGSITQRGTHEELVAQPGLYGELYRKQLSEEQIDVEFADEETPALGRETVE